MDAEALLTISESIDLYFNQRKFFVMVISTTNVSYKSSDVYVVYVRCGTHDYIAGTRESKMSTSVVTLSLYLLTGKKIIIVFELCLFLWKKTQW